MLYTEEELKMIVEQKLVFNFYPYDNSPMKELEIDHYIKRVVGSLGSVNNLKVEVDFDSFGSGYASFVNIFCYKKDGSSTEILNGIQTIEGLLLYISRHAPVATFGRSKVTRHSHGGSFEFLSTNTIGRLPNGDWDQIEHSIRNILNDYGYILLTRDYLEQPIEFEISIPTIINENGYRIFDCFFFWED
ncbi:hypothetical protein [Gorillibacterium massiliense]|uniref:hypothetical protein n=1 Tax=Gorillibacterium massiliense TaxID=1280390 RepID=UPI00059357EB|nr:hypothetical protein [Gorillibacterium massiliense]